jgi:transposase
MSGGYQALEQFADHSPKNPTRTSAEVEQQVVEMKQAEPSWGKRRIAEELAKKNSWVPLVSPNTVRRILQEAGLWPEAQATAKKGGLKP